jgi:hypothetical protein
MRIEQKLKLLFENHEPATTARFLEYFPSGPPAKRRRSFCPERSGLEQQPEVGIYSQMARLFTRIHYAGQWPSLCTHSRKAGVSGWERPSREITSRSHRGRFSFVPSKGVARRSNYKLAQCKGKSPMKERLNVDSDSTRCSMTVQTVSIAPDVLMN